MHFKRAHGKCITQAVNGEGLDLEGLEEYKIISHQHVKHRLVSQ
jgi:hypothetical protein